MVNILSSINWFKNISGSQECVSKFRPRISATCGLSGGKYHKLFCANHFLHLLLALHHLHNLLFEFQTDYHPPENNNLLLCNSHPQKGFQCCPGDGWVVVDSKVEEVNLVYDFQQEIWVFNCSGIFQMKLIILNLNWKRVLEM